MQGLVRGSKLSVEISTECAHCRQPIRLQVDSRLRCRVLEGPPAPLVFEPEVDWATFPHPTIIDGY